MKELIKNKLLRRMDLFALIGNKGTLQPEPWCCAGSSQGPTRILHYFDQLTLLLMKQERISLLTSFYKEDLIPAASTHMNL